jgi:signal transduction histidine kinase
MKNVIVSARPLFEPVIGMVWFALWAVGEVGRNPIAGDEPAAVLFWAVLLLQSLAIALSRLLPLTALALGASALAVQFIPPITAFDPALYVGNVIVVVVTAATLPGKRRLFPLAYALGGGALIAWMLCWGYGIDRADPAMRPVLLVSLPLAGLASWSVGILIGARRRIAAQERALAAAREDVLRAETETIVAGERERIAQDVHDIMAHSLSVILAQADGSRALSGERPEAMAQSLETIAMSARSSLTEVRMLIETLVAEPDGRATPAVGDIDALVERMRDAGLSTEVERFAEPAGLTPAQELAVYRIVQEALTNALKHGGSGASARVVLDARGGGMMVSVASTGGEYADAAAPESGSGRGVHGMRERARLAGGWLDAGPDEEEGGGFLVTAFIPAAQAVLA